MRKRVAFKTLGCRLNLCESDALVSDFIRAGYEIIPFSQDDSADADAYIINTCSITRRSDQKCRKAIHHAQNRKSKPLVVVTGCYAPDFSGEMGEKSGNVLIVRNPVKGQILKIAESFLRGRVLNPEHLSHDVFNFNPADKCFHLRKLIKIQDGCDNFCSYCVVPFVRGRAISRPSSAVLDNIRQVLDFGSREIILTGINIGKYRHEDTSFVALIEKILQIPGEYRVRLSSLEPECISEEELITLLKHPKLCPHLHICLQSGSDRIISSMNRDYTAQQFLSTVTRIRNQIPSINITSDVMVGFPGESEEDFRLTCNIVRTIAFSHVHTFKYSKRAQTSAIHLPDQVPEYIKRERSEIIRTLSEENRKKYLQSFQNGVQTVLIETIDAQGKGHGYGEHYVPIEVHREANGEALELNTFYKVHITGLRVYRECVLIGKRVPFIQSRRAL